jgi:cytochrome c1
MSRRMRTSVTAVCALVAAAVAGGLWYEFLRYGGLDRLRSVDTAVALTQGGNPSEGFHVIQRVGCVGCHEIPGVRAAHGKVGPDLTGFKDRALIAGVLANSAENLQRWIRHPQAVDPKTAMPDLGLTDAEARDVAAYLYSPRHD